MHSLISSEANFDKIVSNNPPTSGAIRGRGNDPRSRERSCSRTTQLCLSAFCPAGPQRSNLLGQFPSLGPVREGPIGWHRANASSQSARCDTRTRLSVKVSAIKGLSRPSPMVEDLVRFGAVARPLRRESAAAALGIVASTSRQADGCGVVPPAMAGSTASSRR